MKIEVWSDFVCPFCYIGKRRLEKALAQFPHREHVEVVFRSFELDPAAPNDPAEPVVTMLARKYRVSLDEAKRMTDSVAQQGAAEGLLLRFDTAVNANTFDAHRLLKFAATQGLEQAMAEKLFFAHFTASEHIGRRETLLRLAVEVGLKRSEVEQLLQDGDAFAEAVGPTNGGRASWASGACPFSSSTKHTAFPEPSPPPSLRQRWNKCGAGGEPVEEWRFLHTGKGPPALNMAIDEAIMLAHAQGLVPPTVRFYGWDPPTLSIGYFQRVEKEVDIQRLRQRGLGFVRRPTGGRAVLHDRRIDVQRGGG